MYPKGSRHRPALDETYDQVPDLDLLDVYILSVAYSKALLDQFLVL